MERETPSFKKIAWLHVPKCGSTFATTVLLYANQSLPENFTLCSKPSCFEGNLDPWVDLWQRFSQPLWFPNGTLWKNAHFWDHHRISAHDYTEYKGYFVGMFRSPASRAASAFENYGRYGHPSLHRIRHGLPAHKYARRIQGNVVKMIAGQSHGLSCDIVEFPCDITIRPNVGLALQRLSSGFAFVGLTEEWTLSVCLFHIRFGGRCSPGEFLNTRPSASRMDDKRRNDTLIFSEYHDPYDGALFAAVKLRFWSDVEVYGVTRAKCREVCPFLSDSALSDAYGIMSTPFWWS